MKNLLYLFLCLCNTHLLASQNKTVTVTYNVIVDKDEIMEKAVEKRGKDDFLNQFYLKALAEYKDYTFKLVKGDTITEFYLSNYQDQSVEKGNNIKGKAFPMAGYLGTIYQTRDKVYKYLAFENLFSFHTIYNEWEITSEEKMIDGRRCYKALGKYNVVHGDTVFNHALFAWFCPDLPFSIGPMGYGGLPGLILEIRIRNATYIASQIDLNSTTKIDLDFFNKYKKVSQEVVNKKIDDDMENLRKSLKE